MKQWLRSALVGGAILATAGVLLISPVEARQSFAADAYGLNAANEINDGDYTMTFTPDTGTNALVSGKNWVTSLTVDRGCPEGYRAQARVYIVDATGKMATSSGTGIWKTGSGWVGYGTDGNPISISEYPGDILSAGASAWQRLAGNAGVLSQAPAGTYEYVIACDSTAVAASAPIGDSKFFQATLTVTDSTYTFSHTALPAGPTTPSQSTPTVMLSGEQNNTDGKPTITATVKKSGGSVASDATGSVQFYQDGNSVPGDPVSVSGKNGVATYKPTTALEGTADGKSYAFTAKYFSGGTSDPYADSQTSSTLTVIVKTTSEPAEPVSKTITVTIPTSTLKLTASTDPVNLKASLSTDKYTASDKLGQVTVSDGRSGQPQWTLNAAVTPFTGGGSTIKAGALGWDQPKLSGNTTGVTAGAALPPNWDNPDTATDSLTTQLAAAIAGHGTGDTNVNTNLSFQVPASQPAGTYTATLTLTLI